MRGGALNFANILQAFCLASYAWVALSSTLNMLVALSFFVFFLRPALADCVAQHGLEILLPGARNVNYVNVRQ